MNWGTAIKTVFSKYATFSGVASRSEYWYWALFTFVVAIGFNILKGIASPDAFNPTAAGGLLTLLQGIFALGTFLPGLAVMVRRLHDAGFSGHLLWIWAAPMLLMIVMGASYLVTILGGGYGADGASMLGAGIGALLVTLAVPLFVSFLVGIFFFVLTLLPTKTQAQGNKYAK